jgi:hypothetical protein
MAGNLTAMIASIFSGGVTTDPYYPYTTLLLPGNGTNGAQNNTFLDGSTNNFTITRNGNTTQGTFSPFSQTGWGNYFNGSNAYLSLTATSAVQLSNSTAFAIEFWVYPASIPSTGGSAFVLRAYNISSPYQGYGIAFGGNALNTNLQIWNGTAWADIGAVSANTWTHVAVTYEGSGTTLRYFINGTQQGSATTVPSSINYTGTPFIIGARSSDFYLNGYLSNLRIVKGSAVYTSNFTPSTTPLTAITNTSLLTCQSNRFLDNSSSPYTITPNGSPTVVAFSPFNPTASWSAATYGGSGYFDGSGDYLSLSNNVAFQFGTGDFTIEFWHYSNSSGTQVLLYDSRPATTNGLYPTIYKSSGNVLVFYTNSADRITGTTSLLASTWYHVALSRSGTATKLFLNGIQEGSTYTDSNNYTNGTSRPLIGGDGYNASSVLNGYLSGVRIVKGTAVYTGNFTPPSLLPITNDGSTSAAAYPSTTNVNTSFASSATSLLLNFTNAGIYDATSKNDLETVGNAQISTTQSKFGGSSMSFDGNGDWLAAPTSILPQFGTGDFTIEFWWYPNSLATAQQIISNTNDSGVTGSGEFVITYNTSLGLRFYINAGAADIQQGSTTGWTTGQWYYVAAVRSGNTLTLYRNGSSIASGSVTGLTIGANVPFYIGGEPTQPTSINGYLQDVRITKGYARTVTTSPTAAFPTL